MNKKEIVKNFTVEHFLNQWKSKLYVQFTLLLLHKFRLLLNKKIPENSSFQNMVDEKIEIFYKNKKNNM